MASLKSAQEQLFVALNALGMPCLLRVCSSPDALWVCDLPRRQGHVDSAKQRLAALGVYCAAEENGLWRLDWTADIYCQLAKKLPQAPPPLPKAWELHEAYALCQTLLAHPAPLEAQPLEPIRQVLKLPQQPVSQQQRIIISLMDECAVRLRRHQPLPAMAGGLLANWLTEIEGGEPL